MDTSGCFLCDIHASVPRSSFSCRQCGASLDLQDHIFSPRCENGSTANNYPNEAGKQLSVLEETSLWFRHRNEVILDLVEKYPPSGPIIDVGGGNGFVSRHLEGHGFQTVLVEPLAGGTSIAQSRGLSKIVQGQFGELGCVRSIHAVGLFDVLEHLDEPGELLQQIRQALDPGGLVYVTVPACRWLWSTADAFAGHRVRYTMDSLYHLFHSCGYQPVHSSHFFTTLILPILLFRVIPTRLRLRRDQSIRSFEFELPMLLRWVTNGYLRVEQQVLKRMTIPFGSSIAAVFERR